MMKTILISIFTFFSLGAYATLTIDEVKVQCRVSFECSQKTNEFKSLERKYEDIDQFKNIFKLYILNEGVRNLSYQVVEVNERVVLRIQLEMKPQVSELMSVHFIGESSIELPSILPIKEYDFLDEYRIEQTKKLINQVALDKGYPNSKVYIDARPDGADVVVGISVSLGKPIRALSIIVNSRDKLLKDLLFRNVARFQKSALDVQELKDEIESTRQLFLQYGHYLVEIDFKIKKISKYKVLINLEIRNQQKYVFYLKNKDTNNIVDLKEHLATNFISFKREMTEDSVVQTVFEWFELKGYKKQSIAVTSIKQNSKRSDDTRYYSIDIGKSQKTKISSVNFKGNSYFSNVELKRLFFNNGSDQIRSDIHDKDYYQSFQKILKEKYIEKGFVNIRLASPLILYDKQKNTVTISYGIREGIRARVESISLKGLKRDLSDEILDSIENQENHYFNPVAFERDLVKIDNILKNKGYYFSSILNENRASIVRYTQDNSLVQVTVDIELGKKLFVGQLIIIGNKKTQKRLIKRELKFKTGDLLTRSEINQAQTNLLDLGLFSQVRIQPIKGSSDSADILISVKEKDFGFFEFGPGIRSDLGLKLSTKINYNNIDGMNKRISFTGNINRRLNLNSLDDRRRKEEQNLLEYDLIVDYAEDHIFRSEYDFRTSVGQLRKRFLSFDADIARVSFTMLRDFTNWFNASVRYQLETVSQYNATLDEDGDDTNHGHFQIGSITPSLVFDFRDRRINPQKGMLFDLSCEFASPTFFSQQEDELTIDYYKLISRNKFYYPLHQNLVLATSVAFGIQENQAGSDNYIPGIKVFRLAGADIIRGYEDDEMNRISDNNEDISQSVVNSRAYMANIKVEPRYYLSDSMILGAFYDAGRIFLDEFDESDLKSSVGLTFKYLTPVGTLDFDYGIKLLRKKDSSGRLDSPGRLHVSIGFF